MNDLLNQTDHIETGVCPVCGNTHATIPIHQLYADLLVGEKMPGGTHPGISRANLMKQVYPPRIPRKNLATSLNPDLVIALGFIVVAYLVITQLEGMRNYLLPIGIGIILIFAIYLFTRRWFIDYHNNALKHREEILARIRAKADIWMEMIYCPEGNLVFLPDCTLKLDLDKFQDFLNADMGTQG